MTRVLLPQDEDIPPISYCDPAYETVQAAPAWRFMALGFGSVAIVVAMLIMLLFEGMP